MKVFITGATGFIGSHLCEALVAQGHELVVLVRSPEKAKVLPTRGVEVIAGDLSLLKDPSLVLPPVDVVIHLAGLITAVNEEEYREVNYQAVEDLVHTIERQTWRPKRMLFASSLAAAGPTVLGHPLTEQDPCRPVDPYGEAKYEAERFLQEASFPVTSFRPALVFGPRDSATLAFYRMAKFGVGFALAGPPQELSFIHVADLVDGLIAMMGDTTSEHRTFFVASEAPMDSVSLWSSLSSAMERKVRVIRLPRTVLKVVSWVTAAAARVLPVRNQLDDKQVQQMLAPAFSCSAMALQKAYGWEPTRSLEDAMRDAWAWYRSEKWL